MSVDLLGKRDSSSHRPGQTSERGDESLPSYVIAEAAQRLAVLALIYAIVYGISVYAVPFPQAYLEMRPIIYTVGAVFIILSLAFYIALKQGRIATDRIGSLATAFELFGAVGIEIGIVFWNGDPELIELGLSWTAVWIIMFPFLMPTTPSRTAAVATAAATVRPVLFLGVPLLRGFPMPEAAIVAQFVAPTYLCVGIAVIAARVVYGLGQDVAKARRMGSYSLTQKLGQGGMGEVWKARHRLLARPAAIKLLRGDSQGSGPRPAYLQRFEREVQSTAKLRSPNTIDIYDYGVTDDGAFYYVMELLDGLDLDRLVRHYGPLHPARVLHIMRQACHSLGEAHEQGFVHRDVKPANLFLCRHGRDVDHLKVLDFGLVKGDQESDEVDQKLTQAGVFYGTPAYASPEMCRGEWDKVDGRSDLYALACVAFFVLTGRPVFQADNPLKYLALHNSAAPDAPSIHAKERVPQELDRVILDCLEKDQDARIPSVDALQERLADLQRQYPWPEDLAREWWDRYQTVELEAAGPGRATEDGPSAHHVTVA